MRMTEAEYDDLLLKRNGGAVAATAEPSKYRNEKKIVAGVEFDSAKEARRYNDLLAWQMSGQISELETHRAFPIWINGVHVCDYESDFCYRKDGEFVVEDVKSKVTRRLPVYRLKVKLMAAALGTVVREV